MKSSSAADQLVQLEGIVLELEVWAADDAGRDHEISQSLSKLVLFLDLVCLHQYYIQLIIKN